MNLLKISAGAAILFLGACQWSQIADRQITYYPIQGLSGYKGQSVANLWEANGAPNVVKNLDDGVVLWIYYTNFQSVGGGEMISYNIPYSNSSATTCSVKVFLRYDLVSAAYSDCD